MYDDMDESDYCAEPKTPYANFIIIPMEIIDLAAEGKITPREGWLMGLIDGFCNHGKGLGCFASNAYLAKRLGCGVKHVETMLAHLIRDGLVISDTMAVDGKGAVLRRHLHVRYSGMSTYERPVSGRGIYYRHKLKIKTKGKRMIGLDGKKRTTKRSNSSPSDKLMALELLQAINSRKKHSKQTITKESNNFKLIRVKDQVAITELDQTLIYHCSHLRDKYHPQAFSCQAFRVKYEQIRAAYLRDNPHQVEITISPEAQAIVTRLKMLGWKKGSVHHLPVAVQEAVDWIQLLKSTIVETRSTSKGIEEMICQALLERLPRDWVFNHFDQAHRRLHNWQAWNGDLRLVRLSQDSKDAWSVVVSIAEQYAGSQAGAKFVHTMKALLDESK